ncbi:MAG: 16S rRNA (cytosine(1402)-N(4))-methyltransferase RsmH [Phycisphaerales bacterium]|nr:16S rRNA (cytosine(1402)-N(4))-methyltransferase RsmH [Phycisphaerales bacterium]
MEDRPHIPVMLEQAVRVLEPDSVQSARVYADCTAGLGGHAAAVAARLPAGSSVVLNDLDRDNLRRAAARVRSAAPGVAVREHHGSFAELPRWLDGQSLGVDLLLADLGFASPQVDDPSRGLSFLRDGPLDMRFDRSAGRATAAELVASLPEADLAQVLFEWGEERHSRAVARGIVQARRRSPVETTGQLAEIVRQALRGKVPPREVTGVDPATKTFQALRIAVNDEIGSLLALLDSAEKAAAVAGSGRDSWLRPGATLCVITFHSLEDRPVKQSFARLVKQGLASEVTPKGKPLPAGDEEVRLNPRSRSAKMRAVRLVEGSADRVAGG